MVIRGRRGSKLHIIEVGKTLLVEVTRCIFPRCSINSI